jgi:hypothetical protein
LLPSGSCDSLSFSISSFGISGGIFVSTNHGLHTL